MKFFSILFLSFFVSSAYAQELPIIRFATDWKAQAEQGGFYQAKAMGLYEKAGLDVRIISGGPGINIPQLLGAGAIEFGMGSNAFIPLNMVKVGIDAKVVMAAFQKDPQVLITHPRTDIRTLADMRGHPIMIADATIGSFWIWLKSTFQFEDRQIRKYTFNLAPFLVNDKAIQQGYVTSEPYTIEIEGGITPQVFLLSDYGYPGYAAMVMAQNQLITVHPDIVHAFVRASQQGWQEYIYGNPSAGDTLILANNPDMSPALLAYARKQIRDRNMLGEKIGYMDANRWRDFYTLMQKNGIYDTSLVWQDAFTLDFINEN